MRGSRAMLATGLIALGAAGTVCAQSGDTGKSVSTASPPSPTTAALPSVRAGAEERLAAVKQDRHTSSGEATLDVEFTVDRLEMTVAERVYAVLTVETRTEASVSLPDAGTGSGSLKDAGNRGTPATLGDFNVVSRDVNERVEGARRRTTVRYVLEPFLAGDKTIPALEVRSKDSGKMLTLKTEPVKVVVRSVAGEKDDASTPLEPARGTLEIAPPVRKTIGRGVIIGGAAAVVGMLAAFGFVFVQSRRRAKPVDPGVRVREGLARVRTMLAADSSRAGAMSAASELHLVLTEYLRDAKGIPADTHTGAELAAALERSTLSPEQTAELSRLLADMERVRFAPDSAVGPVVEQLVTRCGTLVDGLATVGVRA